MSKIKAPADLITTLAAGRRSRRWIELKIAELARGVVSMLMDSTMTPVQAYEELFNLDNHQAIRRLRLHREVRELFEWGMELMSVGKHAPTGLAESYDAMNKLSTRIMRRSIPPARRRQVA